MFTGKFDKISRAEAKSMVENNGGKIISNVSKNLIFNCWRKAHSKKIKLANELKIKILSQNDFEKILKLR